MHAITTQNSRFVDGEKRSNEADVIEKSNKKYCVQKHARKKELVVM